MEDSINDQGQTVCGKCGQIIRGGMWPFCPHPKTGGFTNFRDEYPGGITLENYGEKPVTFYSESERVAYMKAHGLDMRERWAPFPGTDRDPAGVQNPEGYVDDVTMQNRRELFLRAHNSGARSDDIPGVVGKTFSGHLTHADAMAVVEGDTKRASRVGRRIAKQTESV